MIREKQNGKIGLVALGCRRLACFMTSRLLLALQFVYFLFYFILISGKGWYLQVCL
ncbi:uncharacterized protein BDW43DRAFT_265409 [Aspergillus alliaceus]|uniref:uncharacterized protein n=1 Tax=Petromyces alliaceus TaxID=209559 RepID=UPI0012A4698A|nr:uncharacterized protein BDW43DRAFT_265409 [Aspergillus alliaceus]KAB8237404.1 hypothetical protein BDW43DRAFT_265409 [Aspergillus alliaceus]